MTTLSVQAVRIVTLEAKIKAISSDAHQLRATPLLYNILIMFDTVDRQTRNIKHEK